MLAILTSHPIQYQVPLWRALAATDIPFQIWYLTDHGLNASHDREFGKSFAWDIDLLAGYPSEFLTVAPHWNLARFGGVRLVEALDQRFRRSHVNALWMEGWRFQANWQALWVACSAGINIWLRGDSNDLKHEGGVKRLIKRPLMRQFFRRVDRFLCVGAANRRLYESYGVPTKKLCGAPHCVDNDQFNLQAGTHERERAKLRAGWRIPDDAYCMLFCGKFIEKKRPMDLIAAACKIGNRTADGRPIHLLFVGSGKLSELLKRSCRVVFDAESNQAHLDTGDVAGRPTASFVGFLNQSEIVKAYVAADLLVLPSDCRETWGLVVNEAFACGRPAVVSDQCGCAEDLVAPLDREFVFQFGDSNALAKSICRAIIALPSRESIRAISDAHHLRHTVATVRRLYESAGGKQ